ncbi:MAG TPA: hypothetical protein VFA80_07535 [Xanthobacteraceae bacterium]|nr:hypothetical protein [Xanthobacteraceae bacterium]
MRNILIPALLAAATLTAAAPAFADYYIVRESAAGPCHIVDSKPADSKSIVGGDRYYTDHAAAEKEMQLLCKSR